MCGVIISICLNWCWKIPVFAKWVMSWYEWTLYWCRLLFHVHGPWLLTGYLRNVFAMLGHLGKKWSCVFLCVSSTRQGLHFPTWNSDRNFIFQNEIPTGTSFSKMKFPSDFSKMKFRPQLLLQKWNSTRWRVHTKRSKTKQISSQLHTCETLSKVKEVYAHVSKRAKLSKAKQI